MIAVSGASLDISKIAGDFPENGIEVQLLNKMAISSDTYGYDNLDQLKFELNYRREIVNSAIQLNDSELAFSDFKDARCNHKYWKRTDNGGFLKKEGAPSGEAINDIFVNGDRYATECATAIMIVYYKGLLNIYGDELFNKLFPQIYLMDWDVREPLLQEVSAPKEAADILPGDRAYFPNPDFDPATPEWQGENVIVLPDSMYYGHGIGIETADTIIRDLNSRRKEGATRSAYFDHSAGRPNFKNLSQIYYNQPARQPEHQPDRQPEHQPARQPEHQPARQPEHQPARQPEHQPTRQPEHQPARQPDHQPARQPDHQPDRQSARTPLVWRPFPPPISH